MRKEMRAIGILVVAVATAFGGSAFGAPYLLLGEGGSSHTASHKLALSKVQTFDKFFMGSFSRDDRLLALVSLDHTDVVEVSTGRLVSRIAPAKARFFNAAFSPTGKVLATYYLARFRESDTYGKVSLWDVATGKEMRALPVTGRVAQGAASLSFSPDGRLLASNVGGVARLWEVETGREVRHFLPPSEPSGIKPERILLSSDGKWIAVYFRLWDYPRQYSAVHVWELGTGRETVLKAEVGFDWKFSADSTMLAITGTADKGEVAERSVAEIWEVSDWKHKRVIEVPRTWQGAFALAFSPNNEFLAIGGRKKFGIYSIRTGELLAEETHPDKYPWTNAQIVYDLAHIEFSDDGRLLLTGGNDGIVKLWRIEER